MMLTIALTQEGHGNNSVYMPGTASTKEILALLIIILPSKISCDLI